MASDGKLTLGRWRVQVRAKGHYLSDSLSIREDADICGRVAWSERRLGPEASLQISDLIDLHIGDMNEVGKETGRSNDWVSSARRATLKAE